MLSPDNPPLGGSRAVQVVAGFSHTVVRTAGGEAYGFGWNGCGQLASAAAECRVPVRFASWRLAGERVVEVAARGNRTALVTAGDRLVTFGDGVGGSGGETRDLPE